MRAWVVLGIVNGLSYALLAQGLVLVYKAGRFVNFAHAQLGVVSALLLGKLVLDWGVTWWVAFPAAVAVGAAIGMATELLVIRRLAGRGPLVPLVASIGVAQILLATTFWTWLGPDRVEVTREGYPVPFEVHLEVDALAVGAHHLLILFFVPVLSLALACFFRYAAVGKAIRAVACNRDAAGLAGISVGRISTLTWGMAGAFAAVSAILQAPSRAVFDTEALGPSLLLRALGAAAVGGFTSLPGALAAGIGLGVVEGVVLFSTGDAGAADLWILGIVLVALLGRARTAVAGSDASDVGATDTVRPTPARRRLLVGLGATAVAVAMPMVPLWQAEAKQFVLGLTVVVALVALSLTLLTGWGGQVSLAQFALVGVGAYTAARLGAHGWPFLATLVVAGAVGAAVAVAIGLPAVRTPGLTLAVTTLGFAVTSPSWLFRQEWAFPSSPVSVAAPTLPLLGTLSDQRETYYLALALLVTAMAALGWMRRSTPGRVLIAVRDNEVAAQALGLSPVLVKLAALAGSGLLAGMAGVAFVAVYRSIAIETFPPQQSLAMLAVVVVGGVTSLLGAVAGAVALVAVPNLTADWFKALFSGSVQFQLFLSGLGLVITQLANPGGIAAGLRRRRPTRAPTSEPTVGPAPGPVPTRTVGDVALAVEELHVSFGGIAALDGASLVVRRGEIVGLIGTNGAGKTTLLDVVSGVVRAGRGHVVALGRDVTRLSARRRADAGMARSFQDARLFPGLTVGETVKVALAGRWRREGALRAEADEILAGLGLGPWSDVPVAHLSTGTRRLCDLAVQLARKPALLLLDEPTAGIAQRDAEAFGPLLRRITDELGCATLLVEHDMPLMLGIADRVYCMERGRIIAEGTPEQIRNDPGVIASYLGTDEVAVARSGGLPTASS